VQISRRHFLQLAGVATVAPAVSRTAWEQAYPTRPVRIVVGFAAGSGADIIARLIGQWLSERLGQPFIIENRPGGGSTLAAGAVVRAPADGYTLLQVTVVNAINATLYEMLNYNFIRDIAPVASINRTPGVMEVNPAFPAKTVAQFIAHAKANPGKINLAAAGPGSVPHVYGELFKMMAGVDLVFVHYRGGAPMLTDLISGQVPATFDPLPSSIGFIQSGQLRPLGVTTATRLDVLPDVPTLSEFVPGYEATGWQGIGAPKNTPAEIIDKLNSEVREALTNAKFKARLADLGASAFASSPDDFARHIAAETEKWGKVIRAANIKPQ
jgi:tripartite-type tricarboxylate transporter receptor subunit TctC